MPHDARLGLVVGVTLLILVAVLFVRKDGPGGATQPGATPPAWASGATGPLAAGPPAPIPGLPGVPSGYGRVNGMRTHTVEDGETLLSVAKKFYGDGSHVSFLFEANRDRLLRPDHVPTGIVLRIPDLPRELADRGRP